VETTEATAIDIDAFAPPEDEALRSARALSEDEGVTPVTHLGGAWLRWFAGVRPARDVVDLGSGIGYSALWLLAGMHHRGMLTTIEVDADRQARAQRVLGRAGHGQRVRSILGAALTVLPKLADHAYDLVFIDATPSEYPDYLRHATRLLRPGGLLIADHVMRGGLGDASDPGATGLRVFAGMVRDDRTLDGQMLPVGDGMLVATRIPSV
jgi:predicted O-methyltransferase YrrM